MRLQNRKALPSKFARVFYRSPSITKDGQVYYHFQPGSHLTDYYNKPYEVHIDGSLWNLTKLRK